MQRARSGPLCKLFDHTLGKEIAFMTRKYVNAQ